MTLKPLWTLFSWPLVFLFFNGLLGFSVTPWVLFNSLLWAFVVVASIVLHEAGHAIAGLIVGLRVELLHLGVGPRVASRKFGETRVVLHAYPLAGATVFGSNTSTRLRLRLWVATLGGPLVTGILVILSGRWPVTAEDWFHAGFPVQAFVGAPAVKEMTLFLNVLLLATNLFPRNMPSKGMQSDGWRLLELPFTPISKINELLVVPQLAEARELAEQKDFEGAGAVLERVRARFPASWATRRFEAALLDERGRVSEARAVRLDILANDPALNSPWVIKREIAWDNFCLRNEELRSEADVFSAEALQEDSEDAAVVGTRGAVLFWLGENERAIELSRRAYSKSSTMPKNQAIAACISALASCAKAEVVGATAWRDKAVRLDPECRFLPEVEARLAVLSSVGKL